MLDFATPHSTYEPVGENRGRFMVEPLARGFGYTFGNSLRRVLLSSLEGAAISAVKIDGVEHEFSTVPHVKEDVTDIILNLKRLVFVLHGEADEHEVQLVKEGPGVITAADIQLPGQRGSHEPRRLHRQPGGWRSARDAADRQSGAWILLGRPQQAARDDTWGSFPSTRSSPPCRVAYRVEPARVGQRTDFDKLTIEVETNGALDPRTAVSKAAALLRDDLVIFIGQGDEEGEDDFDPTATTRLWRCANGASGWDDTPIEELELGVRSYNCLKREGVETMGDLIRRSEQELMCIPNFGRKSIEEVRERLGQNNLKLRGE